MLLAIDSSTAWAGVALYDMNTSEVVDEQVWRTGTSHCAQLLPTIDSALRRHGVARRDLRGIVVAVGPGTFNGVRIGVATAKGLAAGLGLPVVGVNTLAIYAASLGGTELLVRPLLPASRGEMATALWRVDGPLTELEGPRLAALSDLLPVTQPTLFVGEMDPGQRQAIATARGARLATATQSVRRPAALADLGAQRLARGEDDGAGLTATYLRPPHITAPRS